MKRIISIVLVCVLLCICGCSENSGEGIIGDNYTGLWTHSEYPDSYSVVVYEQTKNTISFVAIAERFSAGGLLAQTNYVRAENITFESGNTLFAYRDCEGTIGDCNISVSNGEMNVNFRVLGDYQGNYSMDFANGSYKKERELFELDWFDENNYELVDKNKELDYEKYGVGNFKELEGKSYMWYGKYFLSVNGLRYNPKVYFSISSDGSVKKMYYGTITEGEYHVYESDRDDFDFRILFRFDNGDEFLLYGKANEPKSDITFYLYTVGSGKLSAYGRYLNETYISTGSAIQYHN